MFGLDIIRRVPPRITTLVFYYALPVFLLIRFLVSTIWGVLLLSIFLYWSMWHLGASKPYTAAELVLWIDGLSSESKTSVVTTMLTVLGFLVAFHTGTLNWKAQAFAQLKEHVASEVESFFTEASRLTIDAQIYVDSLVEAVNCLQSQGPTNDAVFAVRRALDLAPKFCATRDQLSAMSIEVHRIAGRHYSVLSSVWGAIHTLEECAAAFGEITHKMWVHAPFVMESHPDPLAAFLAQVNVADCIAFSEACDRNRGFMDGNIGGIRGMLLAPIVGFNLASRMSLSGKKDLFVEAMQKVRRRN